MSTHTPGPWAIQGPARPTIDAPEGGDYAIMDGGTNVIGEAFYRSGPENTHNARANALMMAAAPELYEQAGILHCLASSPRFLAMPLADSLAELARNGIHYDGGDAVKRARGDS